MSSQAVHTPEASCIFSSTTLAGAGRPAMRAVGMMNSASWVGATLIASTPAARTSASLGASPPVPGVASMNSTAEGSVRRAKCSETIFSSSVPMIARNCVSVS